jgi:eukaryotic-like serine/threonine-protein kinase
MAAVSDVPRNSEEWRAFHQSRVAGFGSTLAKFILGFYVLANSVAMIHPRALWSDWIAPFNLLVLGAGAICAAVWVTCRGSARSTSELDTIDALATVATAACIGLVPVYAVAVHRPEMSAIMGVTIFLILRAIVVPSSGGRTALISAVAVLPALYGAWACHAAEPPAPYKLPVMLYPGLTAVWGGLAVVAATLTSRTIFGLRLRVSEAQKLGQYTLGEKIGEGGMGAVYRASHAMMRREVAIKLLLPDNAGKDNLVRFEREVQLTSRLESPNTIAIFDYGRTPDGVFYYVMEYIDGVSLEDLVVQFGALTPGRAVHIGRQICVALAEAHAIGLIHRDIKPANVALCERAGVHDVVKVFDFGLVKELGTDAGSTATAALTGTPLYLSPEAIKTPDKIDRRSDLYAVGGVLYYLLTGTHVFDAKTIVEVCTHHLHTKPESPSARFGHPLPSDLEAIVLRCLAKEPAARYDDADALRDALDACDCAEDWSEHDAEAWWQAHGAEARAAHKPPAQTSRAASTVAVDLDRRRVPAEGNRT